MDQELIKAGKELSHIFVAIIGGLAGAALGTGTGAVIDSKKKKD